MGIIIPWKRFLDRFLASAGVRMYLRDMNVHIAIQPLLALLAGILILVMPRLLNYIVAIYLILVGLVGLFGLKL
jgi:hypothetical protein